MFKKMLFAAIALTFMLPACFLEQAQAAGRGGRHHHHYHHRHHHRHMR